jgi:hypothetical protein
MICVCSIISVISASYYSEVNRHGFVKLFKFCGSRKFTLHFALAGAFRGATEPGYKCEHTIDFFNYNLEFLFKLCFLGPLFQELGIK